MRSSTSSSDGAPPGAGPGAPGDALGTDAPRPGAPGAPGAYAPPRAPRGPVPFGGYAPPAPADRAPDALDAARRAPWEAPPAPERAVPALDFGRAARVALVCFAVLLGAWEAYWRTQGAVPGTVNSDGLWARARRQVNAGDPRATVFIGSSRTLSNVQLPVWARLEGRPPVQLALEGTSPIGALEDLAADTAFRDRRLVVGVTPPLFFTGFGFRQGVVDRARKETPSQRAGQWLGMTLVEPFLAFQDPDFGLFTVLARQPWPQRPGAEFRRMPPKLFVHSADRNARMWARLERDTAYQRVVQQIWARNFRPPPGPPPPRAPAAARGADRARGRRGGQAPGAGRGGDLRAAPERRAPPRRRAGDPAPRRDLGRAARAHRRARRPLRGPPRAAGLRDARVVAHGRRRRRPLHGGALPGHRAAGRAAVGRTALGGRRGRVRPGRP
jgi:hypothetical protein